LLALKELGAITSLASVEAARGRLYSPDPERHARYRRARERHERLYEIMNGSGMWKDSVIDSEKEKL